MSSPVASRWSAGERAVLKRLRTPERIQRFLDDELAYNKEPGGETCLAPRVVLRRRVAHCFEGALLAAAALRYHGFPPLVIQIRAIRDDDHVLALFRDPTGGGAWGAIAKSNFSGLRYREPVYRSLRELVMSMFEGYYNYAGEKSLRAYSRPIDLSRFDRRGWETAEDDLWDVSDYLATRRFFPAVTPAQARALGRLDRRLYEAGLLGAAGVTPAHTRSFYRRVSR